MIWSDKDYERFAEEMFHVWEGNRYITTWWQHIDKLHHEDVDWYYLVDCIVLELVGYVTLILNAMHDVNKCEYLFLLSFICYVILWESIECLSIVYLLSSSYQQKVIMSNQLLFINFCVQSFGITKLEDFTNSFTSNQCSKCFKKGSVIPCIFTLEVFTQLFYKVYIYFYFIVLYLKLWTLIICDSCTSYSFL